MESKVGGTRTANHLSLRGCPQHEAWTLPRAIHFVLVCTCPCLCWSWSSTLLVLREIEKSLTIFMRKSNITRRALRLSRTAVAAVTFSKELVEESLPASLMLKPRESACLDLCFDHISDYFSSGDDNLIRETGRSYLRSRCKLRAHYGRPACPARLALTQ